MSFLSNGIVELYLEVRSEVEEQVPFMLFQVYIRYLSTSKFAHDVGISHFVYISFYITKNVDRGSN